MRITPILFMTFLSSLLGCSMPNISNTTTLKKIKIGQFIDNGNGTITDTKTNLMWKKCSEGAAGKNCDEVYYYFIDQKNSKTKWEKTTKKCKKYNGKYCVDPGQPISRFHHLEAYKIYDKPQSYAGYNNWRMPTQKELMSIRQCIPNPNKTSTDYRGKKYHLFYEPAINSKVFPSTWTYRYQVTNRQPATKRHRLTPGYVSFSKLCGEGYNGYSLNAIRLVRNVN